MTVDMDGTLSTEDSIESALPCQFVEQQPLTNLGTSTLDFDGLLNPGLKVYEDGGASGCGGKLWPAGELLSRYLVRNGLKDAKTVVELGSGTGLAGLAVGASLQPGSKEGTKIYVTDQPNMIELMTRNIEMNNLQGTVEAAVLDWGKPLPDYANDVDLVLAADCVYLEKAFPLLEQTLLDLTEKKDVPILMTYKKRRKADSRFFKAIKKKFTVTEIKNHADYDLYFRQAVYMYDIRRKR